MNIQPTLLERGTTDHLKITLAECRLRRHTYISIIVNTALFILLLAVMWFVYKYKSKRKVSKQETKKKGIEAERNLMALLSRSGSRVTVQNNMPTW
jgi:cbb3-type cytochrome oxidase subunit 3